MKKSLVIWILIPCAAFAQLNNVNTILNDEFDKANNLYNLGFYDEAIEYYEKGLAIDPSNQKAIENLATSFMKVGNYERAFANYSILFDLTAIKNVQLLKNYAEASLSVGNLEKATYWFSQAHELDAEDKVIVNRLKGIQNYGLFFADTARITLKPVGFNTPNAEFGLRPLNNGSSIVSSQKNDLIIDRNYLRSIETFTNIYTYPKRGSEVDSTKQLIKLPNYQKSNDGPVAQSDRVVAVSRNSGKSKTSVKNTLGIYFFTINKDEWNLDSEFSFNSDLYSNTHPWLNKRGDTLFFASDMPGGQGGFDIYYSTYANYKWAAPTNLGSNVNTAAQELFPMVDGHLLYFSSNGLPGLGGLDNYVTDLHALEQDPANLGYPLNTGYDDMAIYALGNSGNLSSNRPGGAGLDDVYTFNIEPLPPKGTLEVLAIDRLNSLPVEAASVSFITHSDTLVLKSEKDGKVRGELDPGNFIVTVDKEKYEKAAFTIVVKENDEIEQTIILEPIIDLERISPDSILFSLGKYELKEGAKEELNLISESLKNYPRLTLTISAHTDSRGTIAYNQELSEKRAEATYNYLVAQGIDSTRINRIGYGESQLLNRCKNGVRCREEEHAVNRRIEFLLKEEQENSTINEAVIPEND